MGNIETRPLDERRLKDLCERGFTWDTVWSDGRHEDLKTKLLEVGGEAVLLIYNLDKNNRYEKLLNGGTLFQGCKFLPTFLASGVDENVEAFCVDHPRVEHYAGFALGKDGVWGYWGWGVSEGKVLELTQPQLAYYGVKDFWAEFYSPAQIKEMRG